MAPGIRSSVGKTALVLSGGGMFGAYQAGVWRELETLFQPEIVVGASVGALNAWMIAGGAGGDELCDGWTNLGQPGMMRADAVERWIRYIHDRYRPRREFGVVATEVPGMTPRLFRWPSLGWQHLASSCALPLFLKHYRLDGHWYTDGGLQDPLPLWAAVEMGATRIVTVDLLASRPWFAEAAAGLLKLWSGFKYAIPPTILTIAVNPSGRLGSARESVCWSRASAERLIAMGRRDAARASEAVRELTKVQGTRSGQSG